MILLFHLLLAICSLVISTEPEFWVRELSREEIPEHLSLQNQRLGRKFIRGFVKGSWGTDIFPAIPKYATSNISGYLRNTFPVLIPWNKPIEDVYREFKKNVKTGFCTKNDQTPWECCSLTAKSADCQNPPTTAVEIMDKYSDPIEGMPVTFLYRWCLLVWHTLRFGKYTGMRAHIYSTCPNPCLGNPCRRANLVNSPEACRITGIFQDDFECECSENAVWDPNTLVCRPENPCLQLGFSICHPENTIRCIAKDDFQVGCICKAEFMGPDCSLPRDACIERLNKSQFTGNANCQVQFGNECFGTIGTDQYNCTCRFGYAPLLTMKESNCYARRDPCQTYYALSYLNENAVDFDRDFRTENETTRMRKLDTMKRARYIMHRGLSCLNGGQCITSADLTRAMCICPTASDGSPLFLGPNCELPVGTWSAWSSMSGCIPKDCGQTRYRWRRRRCLNTTSAEFLLNIGSHARNGAGEVESSYSPPIRCAGTSEEVIPCDPMDPCMILRLPGYLRMEILDYSTLYYFGFITFGYLLISLLVWYVFASPILKALQKRKRKVVAQLIRRESGGTD